MIGARRVPLDHLENKFWNKFKNIQVKIETDRKTDVSHYLESTFYNHNNRKTVKIFLEFNRITVHLSNRMKIRHDLILILHVISKQCLDFWPRHLPQNLLFQNKLDSQHALSSKLSQRTHMSSNMSQTNFKYFSKSRFRKWPWLSWCEFWSNVSQFRQNRGKMTKM